jgi:hypothetical protein
MPHSKTGLVVLQTLDSATLALFTRLKMNLDDSFLIIDPTVRLMGESTEYLAKIQQQFSILAKGEYIIIVAKHQDIDCVAWMVGHLQELIGPNCEVMGFCISDQVKFIGETKWLLSRLIKSNGVSNPESLARRSWCYGINITPNQVMNELSKYPSLLQI